MKLNEISSKKCWVIVHMTDSSGHFEDVEVEGVFLKEKDADHYLASIWRDYISEELEEEQADELDALLDSKDFSLEKIEDFSNGLESMMAPSFDQMMDEYAIQESSLM